ncbi:MAG TPA: methyltransferase domain-containing protein [Thermoanaerobaculia bacterium]|nr:methyltransferase domain-containing protein [Thermoanaerobaculia bacterium]
MTRWDRLAPLYRPLMWPLEVLWLRRWRRRAASAIPGAARLLEVGAGPAMNVPFYPPRVRGVASDVSMVMLAGGSRREGMARVVADVQKLPFRDRAFDVALATFLFCGVPDDRQGLREVRRVVVPGGVCVFLEHVRPEGRVGGFLADLLERFTAPIFGEHVNRRTVENVAREDFAIERVETAAGTLLRLIVARR